MNHASPHCVIIWEFRLKKGREGEFEKAYGPTGNWVQFFKQAQDYIKTELLSDPSQPDRYITIDEWTSKGAYEAFRLHHQSEYEKIDRQFEGLTEHETFIGIFIKIP